LIRGPAGVAAGVPIVHIQGRDLPAPGQTVALEPLLLGA